MILIKDIVDRNFNWLKGQIVGNKLYIYIGVTGSLSSIEWYILSFEIHKIQAVTPPAILFAHELFVSF